MVLLFVYYDVFMRIILTVFFINKLLCQLVAYPDSFIGEGGYKKLKS